MAAASMAPLMAEEAIDSHGASMDPEQLRAAVRIATDDEQAANLAASRRELERMRAGAQRAGESV